MFRKQRSQTKVSVNLCSDQSDNCDWCWHNDSMDEPIATSSKYGKVVVIPLHVVTWWFSETYIILCKGLDGRVQPGIDIVTV